MLIIDFIQTWSIELLTIAFTALCVACAWIYREHKAKKASEKTSYIAHGVYETTNNGEYTVSVNTGRF